ncbi:chemotaxis protein CheW [Hyphomicrobium sp.]|uniref:chemotaxis protein CheW n=1 Tax=Hyphomicrobium sp. TaxID=82 RepID=UPI002E361E58|nr:chemotaxis protein CheW [Hyphomicrobium sp.]HEX2839746.1 chemotaxis protein CheW [Hyphomicrobium sp.]
MTTEASTASTSKDSMQVLMVGLQSELFAVDVGLVREILDPVPVTEVPGERGFLSGIINVRGKVVPVADLRKRFDMEIANTNIDTRFIVTEIDFDGVPTLIAIVADKVYEVTEIPAASMEEAPKIGMHWRAEFIRFIGKWKDDFVVVPNMERIFN